jgi:hypothetical protein
MNKELQELFAILHKAKVIKQREIDFTINKNNERARYNCFGFALYMLGLSQRLFWMNSFDGTETLLEQCTAPVNDALQIGDIAVYRSYGDLQHLALITDPVTEAMLHKPGGYPLVAGSRANMHKVWDYGKLVEYRRSTLTITH